MAAPASLTYSSNPVTYTKGTAITANTPTSGGGAVVSYSVSPALPTGLSLNTSTGIITGTPSARAVAANYTVTATNADGSTTVDVNITVIDPPASLTYANNPILAIKNVAIPSSSPSSSGGAVVSYSVSPALPAGLSLNTSTGVITGTPTVATNGSNHTVTATNADGSTTKVVHIAIDESLSPSDVHKTTTLESVPDTNLSVAYETASGL